LDYQVDEEFSRIIPRLSESEYQALEADIMSIGEIRVPIVVDTDGVILDGHHRFMIFQSNDDVGIPDPEVRYDLVTRAEKKAWVIRCNDNRRQLSYEQIKELQKQKRQIVDELRAEGKTQEDISRITGVPRRTISDWLGNISNGGSANAYIDLRYKIPREMKDDIFERWVAGETQEDIAADLKITQPRVAQICKKADVRKKMETGGALIDNPGIILGDFRGITLKDKAALVFTDPPYDRESLHLYGDVAKWAKENLIEGGNLLVYAAQYAIPEITAMMVEHLAYRWICCVKHTGPAARMIPTEIFVEWKPLLWFTNGPKRKLGKFAADYVVSTPPEKVAHGWQQSSREAAYYIEMLTLEGELVADPMCGSGTTCIAAKKKNRAYIGIEIDEQRCAVAKKNIDGSAGVIDGRPRRARRAENIQHDSPQESPSRLDEGYRLISSNLIRGPITEGGSFYLMPGRPESQIGGRTPPSVVMPPVPKGEASGYAGTFFPRGIGSVIPFDQ
jgi:16S rRNA G966 N2-methylase RsmD